MIRIDEIYCNTFLPIIQSRPSHSMHWFDPFGSVKFEDLCSSPEISSATRDNLPNYEAVRYLFWDQEPLYKETIDNALQKFIKIFHTDAVFTFGERHIITSEKNSEMVEYIKSTYGFVDHYYFFHGWAALDWYRGYNRSFLIKEPSYRVIKKTFISPNRIVAGTRNHRLLMFYHILKNNMINNHISFPLLCPGENINVIEAVDKLCYKYPDIKSIFQKQPLPIDFFGENGHPMHSNKLSLFQQSSESLLYLVTETLATGKRQHLTEKTFKPICLQMPFIIVGTAGSLEYLRSYGFKTFEGLWDESYDSELDDFKRIEKISNTLKDLNNLNNQERQQLFKSSIPIIEHNYQHFYSGNFENVLWNELIGMINEF